ncbi:MAG: hypothetical protein ACM3UU_00765 [Ignavibacteriales bacterium]
MAKLNCFEATIEGLSFQFSPGIKINEVTNGQMVINGFGTMLFNGSKKITTNNIEEVFGDEKEVWVGQLGEELYIYQGAVTMDNAFIVPLSRYPNLINNKYIKLFSPKESVVTLLGNGRVLSRLFTDFDQITYLEVQNESVITVKGDSYTAIFECTENGFKVS